MLSSTIISRQPGSNLFCFQRGGVEGGGGGISVSRAGKNPSLQRTVLPPEKAKSSPARGEESGRVT